MKNIPRFKNIKNFFFGYLCLSFLYLFLPWKIPLRGASTYGNTGAFLSAWSASRVKKSFLENPPFLEENASWCLAYGLSGLDGGEGGYICGFERNEKKYIYINPVYDCTERSKEQNYNCKKIDNSLVRVYSIDEFLGSDHYIPKSKNTEKYFSFKEKYPNATTYVRKAYQDLNPNKDWFWLKLHYSNSSVFHELTSWIYLFIFIGNSILLPFTIIFIFIRLILQIIGIVFKGISRKLSKK